MIPTLALLAALSLQPHELMVRQMAGTMGVHPDYAACIVRRESTWDPGAIGDQGRAVGLWQWHLPSWRHVRAHMGLSTEDRRHNPIASTSAALWWIRQGHANWWTAASLCTGATP